MKNPIIFMLAIWIFSSPAFAQVFATDAQVLEVPTGSFLDLVSVNGAAIADADGVPVFEKENISGLKIPVTLIHVTVTFPAPEKTFALLVESTDASGTPPYLIGAIFSNSGDPRGLAIWSGDSQSGMLNANGSRLFHFQLGEDGPLALRDHGYPGSHDTVDLTFELVATGDTYGLDAVALVPRIFVSGFEKDQD